MLEDDKEKQRKKEFSRIEAYKPEDNYLQITSGQDDGAADTATQETCANCGLTARNREELQEHINSAHLEASRAG
jgi:hypothetical protein